MILVTGGSGFIGREIIKHLARARKPVRLLLHPTKKSPELPHGFPVDVVLAGESDLSGVRAALVAVDTVIYLGRGRTPFLSKSEIEAEIVGMESLAATASQAGVQRILYLSALGADRASAFPGLRAKADAEHALAESGVPFTIFRSATVYGEGDRFTRSLAMLAALSPGILPMPGDGSTLLQPLWVRDLATCILWTLDEANIVGDVYEIGGPEYLTLRRVFELILDAAHTTRLLVPTRPPYLRPLSWFIARTLPASPVSPLWLDHLAVGRTTDLDTLPREFGLQPARFSENLTHLQRGGWGWELIQAQLRALRGE